MEYTPTEAAKAMGVGKSTVHRLIKAGRLSARRCDDGSYRVDASELARVFPERWTALARRDGAGSAPRDDAARGREGQREASEAPARTPLGDVEAVQLRARVEMLERLLVEKDTRLAREEETVADLRRRLDDAHAKLLPALVASSSTVPVTTSAPGLLARLRSAFRP